MAEDSSPLHGGGSSHVAAPPSLDVRPVDVSAVRPFGGKPHPNPLLANPRPMEPYPVFPTGTSPGKPPPAFAECADVNSDSEPELAKATESMPSGMRSANASVSSSMGR